MRPSRTCAKNATICKGELPMPSSEPTDLDALERKAKGGWWTQPICDAMLALIQQVREAEQPSTDLMNGATAGY